MPTETWAYAGKRLMAGNRLADAWQLNDGKMLYFKKTNVHRIGDMYDVEVIRDEGKVQIQGTPKWLDERAPWANIPMFIAADEVSRVTHTRIKREERSPDHLEEAIGHLRPLFEGCRTHADRTALISSIIDRLYRM